MKAEILIIDDDKRLTDLLTEYLDQHGYGTTAFNDSTQGLYHIEENPVDCVILDVMMPGMDGFTVMRKIRDVSDVPVIMLTARGEVTDRVVGLELGADDYMPKPFEPRELVARIQAVLRRKDPGFSGSITRGEFHIDRERRKVTVKGETRKCTTLEFELLWFFMENPDIVLSRDRIIERLKGLDDDVFDRSIDVLISRLRGKIGDDARSQHVIETVRGSGYRFVGEMP